MNTTLRSLLVVPSFTGTSLTGAALTRYLDADGYRRTVGGDLASLPAETQAAFAVVVQHAQQLRGPDERISRVFGELGPMVPDQTHTEQQTYTDPDTGATSQQTVPVVDSYRQQINLALTLSKLDGVGERTIAVTTEQLTEPARAAVLELWRLLTA